MEVANINVTVEEYTQMYLCSLILAGIVSPEEHKNKLVPYINEIVTLLNVAQDFNSGSVLEFRGECFNKRL